MAWGTEYVEAEVMRIWPVSNLDRVYWTGQITIYERTCDSVFGGSNTAVNFAWDKVDWVYL